MKHLYVRIGMLSLLIAFISTGQAQNQIEITTMEDPSVNAETLVETLLGEGVYYDNVTYQGAAIASGIFNKGDSAELGLNRGIFLTSGNGDSIPGPNNSEGISRMNGMPGSTLLEQLTTWTSIDAALLAFDFIPETDTLRIRYIFGSDEYPSIANYGYADVCGIFIIGPDPQGGIYNNINFANVPNLDSIVPVSCATINNGFQNNGPCINCEYYINNEGGLLLEYDGLTTVLTAEIPVIPCESYHITLGIADLIDDIVDSGIFLEANLCKPPGYEKNITFSPPQISANPVESLVNADVSIRLTDPSYSPGTLYLTYFGNADPTAFDPDGGDFVTALPDSLVFEAGVDSVILSIEPVLDNIIEGDEELIIILENTLGCVIRYDTVSVQIMDYVTMNSAISDSTITCQGYVVGLSVEVFNGYPPYTYYWEPGGNTSDSITVTPESTTTYVVT
ncbi:MAG: choice-of-anchor L domain-containing protein, partial [Bacteroidales bacterium]|nr:choice-of-anchor L domain-containing protein [Bacteroidales bacterium]